MYRKVLYMATVKELLDELDQTMKNGYEVTSVTHLREMREPNMDGIVVTDWLIIFKVADQVKRK